MTVKIYHLPRCRTSRTALEIIRAKNIEPEIIEYTKTKITKKEIKDLAKAMGLTIHDMVRKKRCHL